LSWESVPAALVDPVFPIDTADGQTTPLADVPAPVHTLLPASDSPWSLTPDWTEAVILS
jgi:hypothetical protein